MVFYSADMRKDEKSLKIFEAKVLKITRRGGIEGITRTHVAVSQGMAITLRPSTATHTLEAVGNGVSQGASTMNFIYLYSGYLCA